MKQQIQRIAAYALITAEGQVLLSLLNRGPNRGKWTLIGGGIEFGESPKEALVREAEEEAGISIRPEDAQLIDVLSYRYDLEEAGVAKAMHFMGIVHLVQLPKILECKTEPDGHSSDGTKWFKIADLDFDTLNPSARKILTWYQTHPRDTVSK